MTIQLGNRSAGTVRIYFEKAQAPAIKAVLPQKAQTVEEALKDYYDSLLPGASSFGKTILADGAYIGDIWCYCIDPHSEPNAMLSFCIFDEKYRSRGIMTEAVSLFLSEACARYGLKTVGAFTFSDNPASSRVLKKSGFTLAEEFTDNGRESKYFQLKINSPL